MMTITSRIYETNISDVHEVKLNDILQRVEMLKRFLERTDGCFRRHKRRSKLQINLVLGSHGTGYKT